MQQTIRLGKIWDISVGFNSSWLLIFFLITYSLAVGYMPGAYPELGALQYWTLAFVTSVLFFGSVLWHELAHAWVALRYSVPVRRITLFIFGGVAEMEKESPSAQAEFWIAIAGPISSLVAAGIFYALFMLDRGIDWLAAPSEYLFRINLILAAFNMIPGFPLDGGRVLRALVWYFTDYQRATKVATTTGRVFAFGFIVVGIIQAISGDVLNGLWLAFIGWFIYSASSATAIQASYENAIGGVRVGDIMTRQWEEVSATLPITTLVQEHVMHDGPRQYFVRQTGYGYEDSLHPHGMLTVTDINKLPASRWGITPAERLMVAWQQLITATPDTPLSSALEKMDSNHINQLPIVENDELVGVLNRENVIRFIRFQVGRT